MDHTVLTPVPVKALVLTGFGINCENEMAAAYTLAGAQAHIVHINDIFDDSVQIHDFDIINFPGGFSFGDDLGSGKVMANKIKYKKLPSGRTLFDELIKFIRAGRFILGICNGFQFLVRLGLLPNTSGHFEQEAALEPNDSGHFEDRWVYCRVNPKNKTPFLHGLDIFPVPVRHGEGKLVLTPAAETTVVRDGLDALTYCLADGSPATTYPANPNGSVRQIAALTDPSGHVLGMMPHPEAFLSVYNHPNRMQYTGEAAGLRIFQNIVNHIHARKRNQTSVKA